MTNPIAIEIIQSLIVDLRGQRVLLDSDVARIYGVDTKRINEAVKNNPEKFPEGYLVRLSEDEFENLRSKFSTAKFAKTRVTPTAFPERADEQGTGSETRDQKPERPEIHRHAGAELQVDSTRCRS